MGNWDDVLRLAKGTQQEKLRVVQIVLSNNRQSFPHSEIVSLIERLYEPTEPEAVRFALACGIEADLSVAMAEALSVLTRDPSDIVREQAHISQKRSDERLAEAIKQRSEEQSQESKRKFWQEIKARIDGIKSKFGSEFRDLRLWCKQQLFRAIVLLICGFELLTFYVSYHTGLALKRSTLDTLTQINAAIFALVFTIPLAASQFSKYNVRTESLFDKTNLSYFLVYVFAIFYPTIVVRNSTNSIVSLAISVTCTILTVPYLFRISKKLTPIQVVHEQYSKIARKWRGPSEEAVEESGLQLENLTRIALGLKDYSTLDAIMKRFRWLIIDAEDQLARTSVGPLQPGALGLEQAFFRIGESCLDDKYAQAIWCFATLGLATRVDVHIGKATSTRKYVEGEFLLELAALSRPGQEGQPILFLNLIEWAISNSYAERKSLDRNLALTAGALGKLTPKFVEELLSSSYRRITEPSYLRRAFQPIGSYPWSFELGTRIGILDRLFRLQAQAYTYMTNQKSLILKIQSPVIRSARLVDAVDIMVLQKACFVEEAKQRQDFELPIFTESSEEIQQTIGRSIVLVATIGEEIVGSVRVSVTHNTVVISKLFVHPELRRNKIGTQLMTEIEKRHQSYKLLAYPGFEEPQRIAFLRHVNYSISKRYPLSNGSVLVMLEKHRMKRKHSQARFGVNKLIV